MNNFEVFEGTTYTRIDVWHTDGRHDRVVYVHASEYRPADDMPAVPESENYGTIWVCVDCMLHHANGECGGCHEGHDEEPLSALEGFQPAMGMVYAEHEEDCLLHIMGGDAPGSYECECERNTFSTSQCEGCGSWLHGERHAMTLFKA